MEEINIHNRADEGFSLLEHSSAWICVWVPTLLRSLLYVSRGQEGLFFLDCLLFVYCFVFLSVHFCVFLLHLTSSRLLSPLSPFILSVLYQLIGHYCSALSLKVWCQLQPTRMTFSSNGNWLTLGDKHSCSICFEVPSLWRVSQLTDVIDSLRMPFTACRR